MTVSKTVNITPLMARIMDALYKNRELMQLGDLAIDITDARGGLPVNTAQLGSPLIQLRKLKWVRREKRQIGTKRVGHAVYPEILRLYLITPLGVEAWAAIGSSVDPVKGRHIDVNELTNKPTGLFFTLDSESLDEYRDADKNVGKGLPESILKTPMPTVAPPEGDTFDDPEIAAQDARLMTAIVNAAFAASIEPPPPEIKLDERSFKPSKDKLFGKHTIFTDDSPYMTRIWLGRLRLHIFHRGDPDDPHDHPWDFRTFPFTSYVEEVFYEIGTNDGFAPILRSKKRVVTAWRWHYRKAEMRHRVVGRYAGSVEKKDRYGQTLDLPTAFDDQANTLALTGFEPVVRHGKVVTLVWRGRERRDWGFWLKRAGKYCFQAWKDVKERGFKPHCD